WSWRTRGARPASRLRRAAAPEHALEEVREGRLVPEQVSQIFAIDGAVFVASAARSLGAEALPIGRLRATGGALGPLPLFVLAPARSDLIVLLALVGGGEELVRLVDLLEAVISFPVPGIDIRMVLPSELAVGGPDLL